MRVFLNSITLVHQQHSCRNTIPAQTISDLSRKTPPHVDAYDSILRHAKRLLPI